MNTLAFFVFHPLFTAACSFVLGIGISSFIWKNRKRRVLKNLEQLITNEESEYTSTHNPKAQDIEEGFRTLFIARKQELMRLQQLETYRRDYLGNVAHELKTPLFSIQGYIETVLDDPDLDRADIQRFLKKANKNVDRLGQLVNDLDAITKYESGVLHMECVSFNILDLIREVIDELEIQASQKEIRLLTQTKSDRNMVWADRARIRQVLVNLGFNSIKYGIDKGTTHYRIFDTGTHIIIEVADNGIGISPEHVGRIFERFYRVDAHRNRETGGSGLGLSICKHIIEAHGETIKVMSTVGAGSSFTFALPKPPENI
jgi:two-component system, OmpR family, phosphate regulon sensor histidine kinase PhoR